MLVQVPQVSEHGDGLLERFRNGICIHQPGLRFQFLEHPLELVVVKTERGQVDLLFEQAGQFGIQLLFVPLGILGDLVVGNAEGSNLRVAQVIQDDHRKLWQAQELSPEDPAVAGNNIAMPVDQNGIDHAVVPHTAGNLPNLFSGMGPSIRRVGNQAFDGPDFQVAYND
jgi:hypothetical protein